MELKILLLFCSVVFLCTSCGTAKNAQKKNSKETTTTTETKPAETKTHPAVYIDVGTRKKTFYVGLPNTIKIYAEGGSTAHLDVSVSGGQLRPADVTKGLYSYTEKIHGLAVEVIAKDTASGVITTGVFDVVQIPAPDAYVWTYRKILKGNYLEFTAEEFKTQNAVVLQHSERIPVRCNAESYTIIQISAAGKRTVHENTGKNGLFDETALAMISTTQKGDVFVFENIKTSCSPFPIKNIAYVIK